jgi:signal transduction histidine kinase
VPEFYLNLLWGVGWLDFKVKIKPGDRMKTKPNPYNRLWKTLGATPLWLKILGIVVLPLGLAITILALLVQQHLRAVLGTNDSLALSLISQDAQLVLILTPLVGLALAVILSRVLSRPLEQLLVVIRRVQAGDLQARVEVWAEDEIGQVQVAFNQMVDHLEAAQLEQVKLNQELRVLNDLSSAVALGETSGQVIPKALEQAVYILGADVGTFYTYDAARQMFHLEASRGFLDEEQPLLTPHRPAASTPMRRAVEAGRAVTLDEVQSAEELSPEFAALLERTGFRSWACAPIRVQGQTAGVINLGKRQRLSFSAEDLRLLEAVGNVASAGLANARLLESLRIKETEMRHALRRAVALQEDERRRISRELHDEVGQALTSILIRLKTLQQDCADPDLVDRLDGLRYLTGQSIEELRRLAMDLRPAALDNLGLTPALRWYTEQFAENTGVAIRFSGPEPAARLPGEVEVVLYRVAQEGITNAIRHSQAQQVEVVLRITDGVNGQTAQLEILDDGTGFDPQSAGRGLGLVGIQERVDLLGGVFHLRTTPGEGTRLWVEIAVENRSES